jgi:hypothetical protein
VRILQSLTVQLKLKTIAYENIDNPSPWRLHKKTGSACNTSGGILNQEYTGVFRAKMFASYIDFFTFKNPTHQKYGIIDFIRTPVRRGGTFPVQGKIAC